MTCLSVDAFAGAKERVSEPSTWILKVWSVHDLVFTVLDQKQIVYMLEFQAYERTFLCCQHCRLSIERSKIQKF